jgi:sugar O-acyltransferase (sialic acid O-acetyltransferase NeuD family)
MATQAGTLLIFGGGGHGRVVADAALLAALWQRVIATDRDPARCHGELLPGIGLLPAHQALQAASSVHVAIGDADSRAREVAALSEQQLTTIVHPRASVSAYARVKEGCFIAAQAVVAPSARLGVATIVNHGAVVDHDVAVGDFTHIAPGVTLGGGVSIGNFVLVGSGACVLPGLRVADRVVIGAGSVVCDDITEPGTYAGTPARRFP